MSKLHGTLQLMAQLLYGCGLRLNECVRLRVKDVDFGYLQITVRAAKGGRDRVTMLPVSLVEPLRRQIANAGFYMKKILRLASESFFCLQPLRESIQLQLANSSGNTYFPPIVVPVTHGFLPIRQKTAGIM